MIKNSEKYSQGVKTPNADEYPFGGSLNSSSDIAEDGFPMDEQFFNDINGLFQTLVTFAGIEPNNIPDSINNPQLVNALVQLKYNAKLDYVVGSVCIGADGKVYMALKINGASNTPASPVSDGTGTWDELLGKTAIDALLQVLDVKIDQLRIDMDSVESAIGGGSDRLMYPCDQLMTTSFTLPANKNCFMAGPLKLNANVILNVPDGARLVVI